MEKMSKAEVVEQLTHLLVTKQFDKKLIEAIINIIEYKNNENDIIDSLLEDYKLHNKLRENYNKIYLESDKKDKASYKKSLKHKYILDYIEKKHDVFYNKSRKQQINELYANWSSELSSSAEIRN